MKKLLVSSLIISSFLQVFLASCKSSTNETKDRFTEKNELNILQNELKTLVIEDSIALVYINPDMAEQAFVLSSGTKCKIIEKGIFTVILGVQDFWYHIQYKEKQGWIFGAYTSLKQNSEFDDFLKEFNKEFRDTLSRRFSIAFLNRKPGFKPLEFKRLDGTHYAALFYNDLTYPIVEILLMVYESGKPIKEFSLFKDTINNCSVPQAFFTSTDFIKFIGPSCNHDVSPIMYYQILKSYDIKVVNSSITAKTAEELIPAIKAELMIIDASISDDCKCTVYSAIKKAYVDEQFIFYTITRDECETICNSSNYTLIAMPDTAGWIIKFEEAGGFKAIYESGIKNKYIVVIEEYHQKHIVERTLREKMYLFDPLNQTMRELNLWSESCVILSPTQYGCEYCKNYTTHQEELIIKGNPVQHVIKKISNLYYDELNACTILNQDSHTETYKWLPEQAAFVVDE